MKRPLLLLLLFLLLVENKLLAQTRTITASQEINICEGEDYMGISVPGIYVDTFIAVNGCDSILTTTLNILPLVALSIDTSICEGDIYNGPFSYVLPNEFGCDTIVIINVNVEPLFNKTESYTLCPGEDAYGIFEEGIYTLILSSVSACDTILNLIISELPENDPACITAVPNDVLSNIRLYPNPVKQFLFVEHSEKNFSLMVFDLGGKKVLQKKVISGNTKIDCRKMASGVYFIHFFAENGTSMSRKILILND